MAVLDDYEGGDISGYGGDTGSFDVTTNNPYEGSYSLEVSRNTNSVHIADTDRVVGQGDLVSFRYYANTSNDFSDAEILFGAQSESGRDNATTYALSIQTYSDTLLFRRYNNGTKETETSYNASIPSSEWVQVQIDWRSDGDIEFTLENSSGSTVANFTVNDSTYTSGGIGFGAYDQKHWLDLAETIETPSAPQNVTFAVEGDDDLDVSWDEPSGGISGDGSYDVEVSEDRGGYTRLATTTTTTYSYAAPTSVNEFKFRVRASNSSGSSDWAYSGTKATDPTSLSATVASGSQIDLAWTGTADATSYRVLRAQASDGSFSEVGTPSATTFSDTGLENGEQYFYQVQAVYSGTNSQLSNKADGVTDLPAPTVSLDASVEDEITVSWTLNDNSSDGSVEIYRSTDGSLGALVHTETALSTTSYTDTNLDDGERYYYTVRRVTDHTNADTQQDDVTVLPAPTELTVSGVTDNTADLTWTDNHDNGETLVQYKPTSSSSWTTFSTPAIGTNAETLTGLRNGEEYDARILASTEHTETEDI